ncbi:MAG: hypothetical protein ACOCTH_01280 [Halodesulfurarchaeum sp.]
MSDQDPRDTGIPTRAIHEAYLEMQRTHRDYRRARDNNLDTDGPQGELQDAVLTFYELVRPHLKHESGLSDYWSGHIPDYAGWNFNTKAEAVEYVRENGTGVYQVQVHPTTVQVEQEVLADGGVQTFDEWHELLDLSWTTERLLSIEESGEKRNQYYARIIRAAVLPLRELDHWKTHVRKERVQGNGFMAGEAAKNVHLEYQNPVKLVTAKRLLVEAADKLGALSDFDASTSRTEITREDLEKVEQWRQKQLD